MNGILPGENLFRAIARMKQRSFFERKRGNFLAATLIAEFLNNELDDIYEKLTESKEAVREALEYGLPLSEQTKILQAFSRQGRLYFYFKPNEIDLAVKRLGREHYKVKKLMRDTDDERSRSVSGIKLYKWDNPDDGFFLSRIIFGQGQFLIPLDDRCIIQSFFIRYDEAGKRYILFLESDQRVRYPGMEGSEIETEARAGIQTIVIEPDKAKDPTFTIGAASQKFLNMYVSACRNDHMAPKK